MLINLQSICSSYETYEIYVRHIIFSGNSEKIKEIKHKINLNKIDIVYNFDIKKYYFKKITSSFLRDFWVYEEKAMVNKFLDELMKKEYKDHEDFMSALYILKKFMSFVETIVTSRRWPVHQRACYEIAGWLLLQKKNLNYAKNLIIFKRKLIDTIYYNDPNSLALSVMKIQMASLLNASHLVILDNYFHNNALLDSDYFDAHQLLTLQNYKKELQLLSLGSLKDYYRSLHLLSAMQTDIILWVTEEVLRKHYLAAIQELAAWYNFKAHSDARS
jgi:hypothetical protein